MNVATPWLLAVAFAGTLQAADSVAPALRLGAHSPDLVTFAAQWQEHRAELIAHLKDADPAEQRGAACVLGELGPGPGLSATALTTALIQNSDPVVQRLGSTGLLNHLDDVDPTLLLSFSDVAIACLLLANHPAKSVLENPRVHARVLDWLGDARRCDAASDLVSGRGTTATWSEDLIQIITAASTKTDPDRVHIVSCAHEALCALTQVRRGLAPYAGHYELLVKDWNDTLASTPAVAEKPDAALLTLIAALPDDHALHQLLERGPTILPVLELSMAAATRERRRQLQDSARLLARAVTPLLYDTLHPAGLEGMDAQDTAVRLHTIERVAKEIVEQKDVHAVMHLITYLDDHDAVVRVAALDRLVRLSDESSLFGHTWQMREGGIFPPSQVLWRLRRSLKQGTPDEQVATLQLVASLHADMIAEDVINLMFSPSSMVIDTAIETISHIEYDQQLPLLAHLAANHDQPAVRRIKLLELLSQQLRSGNHTLEKRKKAVLDVVQHIVSDEDDPLVAAAARNVLFQSMEDPAKERQLVLSMLEQGGTQRTAALRLLIAAPFVAQNKANGGVDKFVMLVDVALPYLFSPDHETAYLTAKAFCGGFQQSLATPDLMTNLFSPQLRQQLGDWCEGAVGVWSQHIELAARLSALPRDRLIAQATALVKDADSAGLWKTLIETAPTAQTALDETLTLEHAGKTLSNDAFIALIGRVVAHTLFHKSLLEEVATTSTLNLLIWSTGNERMQHMYDRGDRNRTVSDPELPGATLNFTGTRKTGHDNGYDDVDFTWSMTGVLPTNLPDGDQVKRAITGLEALTLPSAEIADYRDVAVCVLARRAPPSALIRTLATHPLLWQILIARDRNLRSLIPPIFSQQNPWQLQAFVEYGNPDLLPAVVLALNSTQGRYYANNFLPYLLSLKPADLLPHLVGLMGNSSINEDPRFRGLVDKLDLPLDLVLTLLKQGETRTFAIQPYTTEQLPSLTKALAEFPVENLLSAAPSLRKVAAAAPTVFAQALVPLLDRRDKQSAIWLRTNLPNQVGLTSYYTEALTSPVPELWLVGAAVALNSDTLSTHDFLSKLGQQPPTLFSDACLVANRYLVDKMDDEGKQFVPILKLAPAAALSGWLELAPADPVVIPVLRERLANPDELNIIVVQLAAHFFHTRDPWLPIVKALAPSAAGRLDYLLPSDDAGSVPAKK